MIPGVECQRCGCNDVQLVSRHDSWGEPYLKLACGHCRHRWSQPAPESVETPATEPESGYPVAICRECRQPLRVIKKLRGSTVRRLHCQKCNRTMKVPEQPVLI